MNALTVDLFGEPIPVASLGELAAAINAEPASVTDNVAIDKTNQASVTDNVLCGDFPLDATRNEICEFDRLFPRPARLRRRDALLPWGCPVNAPLLTQWQRLIFPPAPFPIQAGEQLREGNRYPDCSAPDWQAHQDGRRTYAVNPVYPGPDGDSGYASGLSSTLTKGRTAYPKRGRCWPCVKLPGYRRGRHGLGARVAMCGCSLNRPRFHWRPLYSSGCRRRFRSGGNNPRRSDPRQGSARIHQEKRFWAFFFETLPDTAPALESLPTGFLEAQAGILAGVVPTAVPVLVAYANAGGDRRNRNRNRYGSRPGETGRRPCPVHGGAGGTRGAIRARRLG
jgi:hypothetical protein